MLQQTSTLFFFMRFSTAKLRVPKSILAQALVNKGAKTLF